MPPSKPLSKEIISEIFNKYKTNRESPNKNINILDTLAAEYGKPKNIINGYIKKYVTKLVDDNIITHKEAKDIYGFKLNKEEPVIAENTPDDVDNTNTEEITLISLHKTMTEILTKLDVFLKKDHQIQCMTETIQKLISARDPVAIVQDIREQRKADGTEYVEPIRPAVKPGKIKPIKIIHYSNDTYKLVSSFNDNVYIKQISGNRWNPDPSKFWTIPKSQVAKFEDILKKNNVPFERLETDPDKTNKIGEVANMVPNNDNDYDDTGDFNTNNISDSIFLNHQN